MLSLKKKSSKSRTIISLRKLICIQDSCGVSSRVAQPKWTWKRVSKKGGEQQEQGGAWERKDESNALQQRTVTEQAFIGAQTAALGGRTRQRQQRHSALIYHSAPPRQLETRWTQKGGVSGDTHWKHNTTSMLVHLSSLEYCVDFYSSGWHPHFTFFPPLHDALFCLPLAWFEGIFIQAESMELNDN